MSEDLERARRIYSQIVLFKERMLGAHTTLVGARIDSVEERFANHSINNLSGAVYILFKEAIQLEEEWRGYYVARGGKLEDIQPIISKSEQS